jgi:hypothetical protein
VLGSSSEPRSDDLPKGPGHGYRDRRSRVAAAPAARDSEVGRFTDLKSLRLGQSESRSPQAVQVTVVQRFPARRGPTPAADTVALQVRAAAAARSRPSGPRRPPAAGPQTDSESESAGRLH